MNEEHATVVYWLCDVYLVTTVLLAAAWLCFRWLRHPIRRLTVSWATASGLAAVVLLTLIPGWPRVRLDPGLPAVVRSIAPADTVGSTAAPESLRGPEKARPPVAPLPIRSTIGRETVESIGGGSRPYAQTTTRRVLPTPMVPLASVAALLFAWLGLGAFEAVRLARRAVEGPAPLQAILRRVVGADRRLPALRLSDQLAQPASLRPWRPVILLPTHFAECRCEQEAEAAISHEWAHIRRGDLWLLTLLRWLIIPLVAHPLYWWLRRAVHLDQEMVADADAAGRSSATDYAEMLLQWCRTGGRSAPAVLSMASRPNQLKRRIEMLLNSPVLTRAPCPRPWRLCAWGLTLVAALVLSVLTLRPPSAAAAEEKEAPSIGVSATSSGDPTLSGVPKDEGKAMSFGIASTSAKKPEATGGAKSDVAGNEKWFVMPVTTELQRITAGRDARVYVLVNGETLRQNRVTLDGRALNLDGLREQLKPYADPENGTVHFYIRCVMRESHMVKEGRFVAIVEGSPDGPPPKKDYVTFLLRWALIGFGKDAGFRDATAEVVYHGGEKSWETLVAELKKGLAEDAGLDDPGIGNERFTVYRVQTALSRFLYPDADCLLHVEVEGGIGSEDLDAIEEAVEKLNLKKREGLYFHTSQVVGGFLWRDTFWKERLGFEHSVIGTGYRPFGAVK